MKYFLSGPVSGKRNYNRRAFRRAERRLTRQGHAVMNPVKLHPRDPESFKATEYLHVCFAMIDICDAVYFLHGWQWSDGAQMELHYATEHHKMLEWEDA